MLDMYLLFHIQEVWRKSQRIPTEGGADLLRLDSGELPAQVDSIEVVLVHQQHG